MKNNPCCRVTTFFSDMGQPNAKLTICAKCEKEGWREFSCRWCEGGIVQIDRIGAKQGERCPACFGIVEK